MHAHALATDVVSEGVERTAPTGGGVPAHAVLAAGTAAVRRMLVDTERTSLRLRSVPMPGRNIIGKLARHSLVDTIGCERNGYVGVRDARGQVGWAALRYLRPACEALGRSVHHAQRHHEAHAEALHTAALPNDEKHSQQPIAGVPFVKGEGDESDIDPNDVKQGQVGDCYFLASMAAVARANPELIRKLIRQIDAHRYEVTLYAGDRSAGEMDPTKVVIDDQFPVDATGQPDYASAGDVGPNGPELWVMLLEKAYASRFDQWKTIEGGQGSVGLNLLLEHGSESHEVASYSARDLGILFEEVLRSKRPLVTNTGSDNAHGWRNKSWLPNWFHEDYFRREQEVGAHGLHEYAIKSVNLKTQTVQIQNPWGDHHLDITLEQYREVFVQFAVGKP